MAGVQKYNKLSLLANCFTSIYACSQASTFLNIVDRVKWSCFDRTRCSMLQPAALYAKGTITLVTRQRVLVEVANALLTLDSSHQGQKAEATMTFELPAGSI